jgi:GT2 family glycosyltransferase
MSQPPSLSVVVVTYRSREAVARTLPELVAQLRPDDELILVDNDSGDGTADTVRELASAARVIEPGANLGFGAACNVAAREARGELLLFLNPDAKPQPGFRDAIERPLLDGRAWAAWQGLVTAEDGRIVNTRGGVVHFTGIAWAGGAGDPVDSPEPAPGVRPAEHSAAERGREAGRMPGAGPPEPGFVSGACLAIPRTRFEEVRGFAEGFFLYHEDVDLSLRLRLAGGTLGVEPAARVDHEYEFAKGAAKWRHLERNRWATIVRTYPAALLAALLPALAATELALLVVAARGGWPRQKLGAWRDFVRALPRLLRERREIQRRRTIRTRDFAAALTADLGSTYLGSIGRSRAVRSVLRAYWRGVLAVLRA